MDKNEYIQQIKQAKRRQTPGFRGTPQCCATCERLTGEGYCLAMRDYPPLEFVEQENDCGEYLQDVPF